MLVKYLRKNNKPYGCFVANKVDDQIVIGYSLCHKNKFMSFVRRSKKFFKTEKMFAKYITEIKLV